MRQKTANFWLHPPSYQSRYLYRTLFYFMYLCGCAKTFHFSQGENSQLKLTCNENYNEQKFEVKKLLLKSVMIGKSLLFCNNNVYKCFSKYKVNIELKLEIIEKNKKFN